MYLRGLFLFFFYLAAVSIIGAKPTEATIIVQLVNGTQTNITSVEIIYVGNNNDIISKCLFEPSILPKIKTAIFGKEIRMSTKL